VELTDAARLNRGEIRFRHQHLEVLKRAGEIRDYLKHESVKLRLADRTWISFDFPAIASDGRLEFWEVKGAKGCGAHWEEDARAKTKRSRPSCTRS